MFSYISPKVLFGYFCNIVVVNNITSILMLKCNIGVVNNGEKRTLHYRFPLVVIFFLFIINIPTKNKTKKS